MTGAGHDPGAGVDAGEPGEARLEEVRLELQRLGYLDRRMERYLLQDAFRPEAPGRTVLALTGKVAFLIGLPGALALTLGAAFQAGLFEASPFDVLPLFVHLLPPAVLLLGGAFLLLALLLVALLKLTHFRRLEASAFALAALAAAATVLGLALLGREARAALPDGVALLGLLALPAIGYGVLRTVHDGLLSLAIRLAEDAPERPLGWRRALVGIFLAAAFVVGLPIFFAVRAEPAGDPSSLPIGRDGGRVLLVGVDGVLPPELLFLLGEGRLPEISRRLAAGAALLPYARPAVPPSDFWTTVATGIESPHHGMQSLDAFRPVGLSRPLLRVSWLRPYWRLEENLGLAEYRAVTAGERRVFTLWELLARGGLPSLVVNWWGTYPVEPLAGRHLAHGAFQLFDQPGALFPPEWQPALAARRAAAALPPELAKGLESALGEGAARQLAAGALEPDAFYREAFRAGLEAEPALRAAALYLPGLDIAASGLGGEGGGAGLASLGSAAFGELLRWQLAAVDQLLAEAGGRFDTTVVLFDPGRRGGLVAAGANPAGGADRGLMLILRPSPCRPPAGEMVAAPTVAASSLLRALGLPQSRELPPPAAVCDWPEPPLELPGYGSRQPAKSDVDAEEYLHSLRSLGYV